MRQYLHVSAGPYQFLLDAEGIHEILELEAHASAAGYRDWRGRLLPSVNGRCLLGLANCELSPSHAGVVYSAVDLETPLMLELDRVGRLRYAEDDQLLALPPLPEKAERLFDRVLPDEVLGVQLYHLRRPLDIQALLREWSAPALPDSVQMPETLAARRQSKQRKKK